MLWVHYCTKVQWWNCNLVQYGVLGYVWAYLSVVELFIQISLLPQCSDSFPSIFTTKMLPLITIFILWVKKVTKKILRRTKPQAGLLLLTQQKTLHEYWHIACTVKDIKQTNRLPCVACLIKEYDKFFTEIYTAIPIRFKLLNWWPTTTNNVYTAAQFCRKTICI